jgi:3-isopropylmalate dehydratase small subunit
LQTIVIVLISTGTVIEKRYIQYQKQAQAKKSSFSDYKEEFVITKQEEREGGYFGRYNFKTVTT